MRMEYIRIRMKLDLTKIETYMTDDFVHHDNGHYNMGWMG
jgi:hypothetical protein